MITRCHRRRGSIYVVVLGTAMIVTVIGLSALMALRVQRRSTEISRDYGQARLHAQSAIEMGFLWISDDPNWRDNRLSGAWATDQPIGDGTFSLDVVDPDDANLKNAPNNFVVLTGTGAQGDTRYKLEVTIQPQDGGLVVVDGTWRRVVD